MLFNYGFRARAFGASRNDEVVRERKGVRQCFRYLMCAHQRAVLFNRAMQGRPR
jgi:hypothetical protein